MSQFWIGTNDERMHERLRAAIDRQTCGRARMFPIPVHDQDVVICGRVDSYHVLQLVLSAVRRAVSAAELECTTISGAGSAVSFSLRTRRYGNPVRDEVPWIPLEEPVHE